jgi:hypothetical protein
MSTSASIFTADYYIARFDREGFLTARTLDPENLSGLAAHWLVIGRRHLKA